MRLLVILTLALPLMIGTISRAEIVLTAPPVTAGFTSGGFTSGWSYDGGTITLVDATPRVITSATLASDIVDYSLSFTSPFESESYTLTKANSTTSLMSPSAGLFLDFDGVELTLGVGPFRIRAINGVESIEFYGTAAHPNHGSILLWGKRILPGVSPALPNPQLIASVPEPSAFLYIVLGGVCVLGQRRMTRTFACRE